MVCGPSGVVVLQTAGMLLNRKKIQQMVAKKVGIVILYGNLWNLDLGSPKLETPAINYELMSCSSWPVK